MAVNQDRVHGVSKLLAQAGGHDWEELSPLQKFFYMEQTLGFEKAYDEYNTQNNIVEAKFDTDMFGGDGDA